MFMRALALAVFAAVLAGCHTAAPLASRDSPYGVWSTERGQTVEVRRDGTFRFCDGQTCESGRYEMEGASVLLIGFADMPITQRLRDFSGWEPAFFPPELDTDPVTRGSFQLGDGGMSDELRHSLCQDRPCRIVGRADVPHRYRFVKLRDF